MRYEADKRQYKEENQKQNVAPLRVMLANKRLERDAHYVRAPQP